MKISLTRFSDGYQQLSRAEKGDASSKFWTRRRVALGATLCFLMLLLWSSQRSSGPKITTLPEASNITADYFHVLIPANEVHLDLCSTLVSAAVLNYPPPVLVNWGQNATTARGPLAKITGVLEYLGRFPAERENDMVLVVEGYDILFQLRPEVLLERYFAVNAKADARIAERLGATVVVERGIQQKIIFSAQKSCLPWEAHDPPCYAVPESSLPRKVYGPQTDTNVGNEKNPDEKFRPRYLNSGMVMGDLKSMKRLFSQALNETNEDPNFGSDQRVFAKIFGQQELQREVIRTQHLTEFQRRWAQLCRYFGYAEPSVLDLHPDQIRTDPAGGAALEFGIGLDYEGLLGHPTSSAEYDSAWVKFSEPETIRDASNKLGVVPRRVVSIPNDIAYSLEPFWSRNPALSNLPSGSLSNWRQVSLYTNMWSGSVPATILHNAHVDGVREARDAIWNQLWYQPHMRTMLDAYINEPYREVAVMTDGETETAYWPLTDVKWYIMTSDRDHEFAGWNELCHDDQAEQIFRDGKGRWEPPRRNY
ncbi:hypothetical protein BP5796_02926 [Coleophoma crateriformis]|uniref:Uncharacterized protein n=1 Tax=Coleophoma crateriformis TaxID=565419 RepID=A0A3D8SLT7_9HELO|nr:hypothetical protein BP5796_02926 [Coleophoma crateriformis]